MNIRDMQQNMEEVLAGHKVGAFDFDHLGCFYGSISGGSGAIQDIIYKNFEAKVTFQLPAIVYYDGPKAIIEWIEKTYKNVKEELGI